MPDDTPPDTGTAVPAERRMRVSVLAWLGAALLIFAVGHVMIGWASLTHNAADPQGVNAVREDLKGFVMFILGVLAGVVTPHFAGKS